MVMLAIAALLFLAIHILPATPLRRQAIAAAGKGLYMGVFSVLSLAVIIWWIAAFEGAPYDTPLWSFAAWWPWLKAAILLFAFILFVSGLSSPNPTLAGGGRLLESPSVASGVFAITRHPVMWSFGLWGLAHFVSQPNWRGFWFFGIIAVTALGGALLQEQRKARTYGASWDSFTAKTSFVPFFALAQGRATLRFADLGWWRIALAVVLWAAILHLHPWLFGAASLPR